MRCLTLLTRRVEQQLEVADTYARTRVDDLEQQPPLTHFAGHCRRANLRDEVWAYIFIHPLAFSSVCVCACCVVMSGHGRESILGRHECSVRFAVHVMHGGYSYLQDDAAELCILQSVGEAIHNHLFDAQRVQHCKCGHIHSDGIRQNDTRRRHATVCRH